jgi:hypothetical protein
MFADGEAKKLFNGIASRKLPPDIQNTARRKLIYLLEYLLRASAKSSVGGALSV